MIQRTSGAIARYVVCSVAVLAMVAIDRWVLAINATTTALCLLLVVLAAAARWGLPESIFASVAGVLTFNFFFIDPVGTFTVADPQNWVALFAFLVTAITASQLSTRAREKAQEALRRGNDIARLYELSRALLLEDGHDGVRVPVARAEQILQAGPVAFFDAATGQLFGSLDLLSVSATEMAGVARTGIELALPEGTVVVPVSMGTRTLGSLAVDRRGLTPAVLESAASLLAINYERAAAVSRATAAEAARRNEEFKSSLLDGLAHDLKTPLTAIRTCITRLIAIPPRTDEVRQELLSIIDQESVRLQGTITEAVELARIESRALRLEKQRVDAGELAESAVAAMRDQDTGRYEFRIEAGLTLNADRELLGRALTQIIDNARKYSRPGSAIEVEASQAGDDAEVRVLDRGIGIAADELDRVFDKFYRGKRTKDKIEGTGMGLPIARGIVEAHGGSIHAERRFDGGTTVIIRLPKAAA